MKKFFKILGIGLLVILVGLYGAFLFVLPRVVDLNQFKPMVQEIAKEQAKLDVDFGDIKVSTTPSLQAGVEIKDLKVNLPDKSEFLSTDAIRARISLPALLTFAVRVSCAEIESPKVTLDIENGKQFKVVKLVEEILNANTKDFTKVDSGSAQEVPAIVSMIRIVVPSLTFKDYQVVINDSKKSQNMKLEGEKLVLGYYNGKAVKVESDAKLLVDDKEMITTDLKIKSFLPEFPPALDEEDDPSQKVEIPFINPIDMYKKFNLKANLASDIKIGNKKGKIGVKGFFNADDITMNMTGYQMPKSHIDLAFKGRKISIDTDLNLTEKEHLQVIGKLGYGKRAFADMQIGSSDIYFNSIIKFARDILNTLGVENTLADMRGNGYFKFDAAFKTNFKKMKSSGSIIVKDAGLSDRKAGLLIKNGNADICLENNAFNIKRADVDINGALLQAKGKIDEKTFSDLNIYTKNLSLKELYNVFAPSSLKDQIALKSGLFSFDLRLEGALKEARAYLNTELKNFSLSDRANTFNLVNEDFTARFDTKLPKLDGVIVNKEFKFSLPGASSSVYMPLFIVNMDEKDIGIMRSGVKFNGKSIVNFHGQIANYLNNPQIDFSADGSIHSKDLATLAGDAVMPFIDAKGVMPVRATVKGTMQKLAVVAQAVTDANGYFTPITLEKLQNKQTVFQFKADYKGNRIKVKNTGIFVKEPAGYSMDTETNMNGTTPVVSVNSTIVNLDSVPEINLLKISIPKRLDGAIYALKNSAFTIERTMLFAYGKLEDAQLRGLLRVRDIKIPDLFTTVNRARIELMGRNIMFNVAEVLVNGSDFNIDGKINLNRLPLLSINDLNINSNNLDVNKLLEVSEAAMKLAPASNNAPSQVSQPEPLPVEITSGTINFKRIDSPPIVATATRGNISIKDSVFYLTNLSTNALGGSIRGRVNLNLLNMLLGVKVHGEHFNVENALWVLANMKDAISGTASFNTDITMDAAATTQETQMKSLKGDVDFEILKGQLGPFGRLENLILAENIRNSKFFETTIGSVVKSIATIETSHFEQMNGHLSFNDGVVEINPITTIGNVLCLHIAGNMNLLTNDADMKLRAKMGSQLSNMLGPLAALNPINLVKVTPGLNVMAAQAFQFFCEQITLEEMLALPDFPDDFTELSTTKFQIVLRGNLEKPFSMIKSFKWLALDSEIAAAESFVRTLPDPTLVEDSEHATYEEIMQAKAEQEAQQAKEAAKPINRMKRFFSKFKKTNTDI